MKNAAILFAILTISIPCAAATITVNWDGTGDYTTIQAGIDAAVSGADTVEVAEGTYYENINFNGKNIVLTSMDPDDPEVVATTIIDGNQSGSVVTFSGTETSACELTGFTITNGTGRLLDTYTRGGGIYGSSPYSGTHAVITNCTITGNHARHGGGLYNFDGQITNCTIENNSAGSGGGFFYCNDASITNCTITGNTASDNGGGLVYCNGPITNCTITGNRASGGFGDGGGLWRCHGVITNCIIAGNSASRVGGGLNGCDGTITNCIIAGNSASRSGGGLWGCDGMITNCTIAGNSAGENGGGLNGCDGAITNCIIWGNTAGGSGDQIRPGSIPTYSCIQDWTGGGAGNINVDPFFVDTSSSNPIDWDMHLKPWSNCIDRGTNSPAGGLLTTDIEGNPRPIDGNNDGTAIADMGAYEASPSSELVIWVSDFTFNFSADEGGANPAGQTLTIHNAGSGTINWTISESCGWLTAIPDSGSSSGEGDDVTLSVDITGVGWGQYTCDLIISDPLAENDPQVTVTLKVSRELFVPDQYPTIQAGIDASISGDAVVVADGVYTGVGNRNIQLKKDNITVRSMNGPGVTIIDCEDMTRGFYIDANSVELEGFTITNGNTSGYGGGIYIRNGRPVINNCTISGNLAYRGGGIYSSWLGDSPIISNCTISGNSAYRGGGLYDCDDTITNCIIWENTATNSGDQLYSSSVPTYSCIQDWGGGGTGNISDDPLFAAGYWDPNDTPADPNDDFWVSGTSGDYHLRSQAGRWVPDYNYMDPNDTPTDPNDDFWNIVPGDIWVTDDVTSPCIDAGNPASDWTGELWPDGGRINMGAYGGTSEASMSGNPVGSAADFNKDDSVDGLDLQMLADKWLLGEILLAEDINRNNFVDMVDVALFAQEWLWEQ